MKRLTTTAALLACGLLIAACGTEPTAAGHKTSAKVTHAAGPWTCLSASPPSVASSPTIVRSSRATAGGTWIEAASDATKGCVALYLAPAGSTKWRAQQVTADASGGNGVSTLQVAAFGQRRIWVLAQGLPGAGQAPAFLFRTQDGGGTWQPLTPHQGRVFPGSDVPLKMRFTSATDGFITDLNGFYGPPRVEVYRTVDGGVTWTLSAFSVPQQYASALGNGTVTPPAFRNARQGTLRVTGTVNGQTTTLVYGTDDGGTTWVLERQSTKASGG